MFTGLALIAALGTATPATPATTDRPIARYLSHAIVPSEPAPAPAAARSQSNDSLRNGAIIGAVVGGVVAGTGFGLLCHALSDTDNPQCWKAALLWGGIGAGGGAAIGAGVDALFSRRRLGWSATVRF